MVCSAEILWQSVYGESADESQSDEISHSETHCIGKTEVLRILRDIGKSRSSSQRQKLEEQQFIKLDDVVLLVSYVIASQTGRHHAKERKVALHNLRKAIVSSWAVLHLSDTFQEAWESADAKTKDWCILAAYAGSWHGEWPGVSRTGNQIAFRMERLKALGNGQVPRVVKLAWELLATL